MQGTGVGEQLFHRGAWTVAICSSQEGARAENFMGRLSGLCVAASSLYLLAKQRSTYSPVDDSLHARAHAVWREAAADPLEALSACFTNFFMISMCGNSPVAWFAAMSFATIDDASFTTWRDGVFARFGNPYVATDGNFVPSAYILDSLPFSASRCLT